MNSRKIAFMALLSAAAMLLGYIESLIPVFTTVPGMKLGLPNLAVVLALYLFSWREALFISVIRICGTGLLFGNLFSIYFSMAGGLTSLFCMGMAKKSGFLDSAGVSMLGGISHNIGQIIVAVILVENMRIAYYFIPLAITGLVSGFVIGLLSGILTVRLSGPLRRNRL